MGQSCVLRCIFPISLIMIRGKIDSIAHGSLCISLSVLLRPQDVAVSIVQGRIAK